MAIDIKMSNKDYNNTLIDDLIEEKNGLSQEYLSKEQTSLSEIRTEMAYERTSLANSQTFLSYTRTAIAIFASGVGMFEFVSNRNIIIIGIILMIIAVIIECVGIIHFFKVRAKIEKIHEFEMKFQKTLSHFLGGK